MQEERGKRQMQEARDKCMRWMQGVDAGGVQVDPPGWLRAPYSPGPNSQANDFITKRVEKLKSFAGDKASDRPAAGGWDPRWRGAGGGGQSVETASGRRLGPQAAGRRRRRRRRRRRHGRTSRTFTRGEEKYLTF